MNEGWIRLHRRILHNPLWEIKPFSKGQAWIDLLLLANYKKGFIYVRDHKITVERGQVGWSQRRLADRWGWSRTKVRKFLKDLEKEQQIKQQKTHSYTVIDIVNYDSYQSFDNEEPQNIPQENHSSTTAVPQENTNNKNNNNKKNNNSSSNNAREKYTIDHSHKWDEEQPIDYYSFVKKFNLVYDKQLRVTERKRENIRGRLRTFTGKEILTAWFNRKDDAWLTGEGKQYLGDWQAAMRNDEKIDKYLNKDQDNEQSTEKSHKDESRTERFFRQGEKLLNEFPE